jgi:hypothetical protein
MTQQGGLSDEFVSGGGSVINPLFLAADPVVPLGASTKQYVDNSLQSLNANNLISGTIGAARFPAMNGDLSSSAGSTSLILTNTGVTPGTYAKVSVDNKGRILNGLLLSESDIPNISWDKITLNKPTTVDGYGIQDALSVTGGTMTGNLSVTGIPTQANQLINKTYLDSVVGGTTGIVIGDIIAKTESTTPVGFLRCNGAELVKSSYQNLYNVIGDRYTIVGKAGNGKPWQNQYDINTENFSDIMNTRTIQALPGVLGGAATFVTKNRVYVYGGFNGSSHVGTGYTAQINADGTLGAWAAATTLPTVYAYSTAVVTKNRVYLLGGYINNSTATNNIFVADINADGTIGTWSNGPAMPGATAYSHAFINGNRVYVVGGYSGTALSVIYSSDIKEDGSLGIWSTETSLPFTLYQSAVGVIKNRVYIFGGYQNSVASNAVYSANLNSDGSIGSWIAETSLPVTFILHQVFVTRNVVYMIGGLQSGAHSANIYKATIRSDGSISGWQLQMWTLQATAAYFNITATKDRIYVLGGMLASAWSGNCWMGDITGGTNDYSSYYSNSVETNYMVAGSGKPWQQQYQINETQSDDITGWVTETSTLPTTLSNSVAIVTKNYAYLIGGMSGAGNAQVNTVYVAAINADGTLGTWSTTTNLPVILYLAVGIVVSNRIYIFGGSSNSGSSANSTVYTAIINSDGTLDSWSTSTALATAVYQSQVILTRNKVYLLGGKTDGSTHTSVIQSANIYPNGGIGTWSNQGNLPTTLSASQAVVTKNRVYMLGGNNGGTVVSTVYTAPINSDGTLGTWTSGASLPGNDAGYQVFVTKNTVYVLGGNSAPSTSSSTVYKAQINADGIIGTWSTGTSIPANLVASQLIATKNRVYLLGGYNTTSLNTIYSAPILEGLNDYSSYYAEDTVNYTYPGSGKPWETQYHFNTTQAGDITGWTTSATNAVTISIHATIVTKNRVYVGGGSAGQVMYTAPINSDGSLGAFTSLGNVLPGSTSYTTAVVTKNRAYIIGGTGANTMFTAVINADGTLGTWSTVSGTPVAFSYPSVFITKNKLYVVSGSGSGTGVYYATINNDGTLGGWRQSPFNFPVTTNLGRALVTKNRVYIIGGNQGGGGVTNVYTASIDPEGNVGNWTAGPSLLTGVEAPIIIASRNTVIIGAGYLSGGSNTNVSQIATINADGTLGTWSYGTVFPMSVHSCSAVITNGKIHLIGGAIASGVTNSNIYTANFAGGLNDYSPYYNGDIAPIEQFVTVAKFKIPDASFMNDGLNYFIKY